MQYHSSQREILARPRTCKIRRVGQTTTDVAAAASMRTRIMLNGPATETDYVIPDILQQHKNPSDFPLFFAAAAAVSLLF